MHDDHIQPGPSRRRRKRRDDYDEDDYDDDDDDRIRRTDGTLGGLIPYRNPLALTGYYMGVFSLIPCAGLALGPTALVLGILGIQHRNKHPKAGGLGHAITAIVLGSITTLGNWGLLGLGVIGIYS